MNLKLKKVVKENVVDYGTPDPINRGFEQKFQMYTIVKDFKRVFKKQLSKSPKLKYNIPNTEKHHLENKYYKKIFSKYKIENPLENLRDKFKNIHFKSNENLLPNINNPNDINLVENSQKLQISSPFMDSIGSNIFTSTNSKTNENNDDKKGKKINLKLINNITKSNEENKIIHDYDYIKYKQINNMRNHFFKLKYRDYIKRKIVLHDTKNKTNNNFFDKTNLDSLKIKKNEESKMKLKESSPSLNNNSEYFSNDKFSNAKTMKLLKTKYNFYQPDKINMFDINNQYFGMIKKVLNNSPEIKLYKNIKESQKRINKIKTRYVLRRIIK
jgi:hypothetical protein